MCLLEGHLAGPFDDGLPDLLSESLVSIRGSHQFVSYPGFSDIFLGLNSIVNVPGSLGQRVVGFFNVPDPSISSVNRSSA